MTGLIGDTAEPITTAECFREFFPESGISDIGLLPACPVNQFFGRNYQAESPTTPYFPGRTHSWVGGAIMPRMGFFNTCTVATAFAAGLFFSAVAMAQSASGAEQPVVQHTVEHIRPDGPAIRLNLGSGTLIHLPQGARSAFIADPAIADVQITSPTSILLYAKKGGDTVMYAEDNEGNVLLNAVVRVRPLEVQVWRPEKLNNGNKETSTTRQATTVISRSGNATTYSTKSTTETGPAPE